MDISVPTLWGNHVLVRQAYDAYNAIAGVGVDFLEPDGRSKRDMEALDRVDALVMALAMGRMAVAGLDARESASLYERAMNELGRQMADPHANIFPFHAPAADACASSPTVGVPAGGVATTNATPPAGVEEKAEGGRLKAEGAIARTSPGLGYSPPAPPQAGGDELPPGRYRLIGVDPASEAGMPVPLEGPAL